MSANSRSARSKYSNMSRCNRDFGSTWVNRGQPGILFLQRRSPVPIVTQIFYRSSLTGHFYKYPKSKGKLPPIQHGKEIISQNLRMTQTLSPLFTPFPFNPCNPRASTSLSISSSLYVNRLPWCREMTASRSPCLATISAKCCGMVCGRRVGYQMSVRTTHDFSTAAQKKKGTLRADNS